jgi:hypothetical protein
LGGYQGREAVNNMTRKRYTGFLLLLALLIGLAAGAFPQARVVARELSGGVAVPLQQTYSFAVPELLMDVFVQPDASARIIYTITFENYGSPIDIVDIGTPSDNYNLNTFEASINGQPLTRIRRSTYIDTGVEIDLGGQAIPRGETATLTVAFTAPDMVYADTTAEELASMQVTPTWFDGSAVQGTAYIEIRAHTLPGVDPDAVLYQDVPFSDKYVDDEGRVVAVWSYEDVRPTQAYRVGVSFPREGMTRIVEVTFWDLVGRWLGGAGAVVGGILATCLPLAIPIIIFGAIARAMVVGSKPNYLPPIAQVEGGGIKRGLTAPEAAALLEMPLTKVLGLVVFGLLEKRLVRQTDHEPLKLEVVEDFRVRDRPELDDAESRERFRRQVAQQKGTVIHKYEHPFLDLIEAHPDTPVSKLDVIKSMQALVDEVAAKMQGFDLSDTQDYYRRVIERALEQAQSIGDVEQREAYLDRYYPWVMMQPNYRPAMRVGGYHYWPMWARQSSAPAAGSRPATGRSASGSAGRSTTTFGDVSASFAGWAETTMGGMAAAILPTALSKPAPPSTSSGGSSGSSRSSCACACAGCACACACAGGGR